MSKYQKIPQLWRLIEQLKVQAQLKAEHGAKGIRQPLVQAERALDQALCELKALPIDEKLAVREPNDLARIKSLRPAGPRRIWGHFDRGAYGEMFFAAAIAAAFTVDDPVDALRIGLSEIPRHCALAKAVRWALRVAPEIKNYKQARAAVDKAFESMHDVHTINNACLTIWGITIGGTDFTKVIGETVAMGLDNDCTAATAGSIVGAVIGKRGIPEHWYRNFNNKIHSYLIGKRYFSISGVLNRFEKQARRIHSRQCVAQ